MKYFNSQDTTHRMQFITREFVETADLSIFDKFRKEETILVGLDVWCANGYASLKFDFEFRENATYFIKLLKNNDILFQDLCKAI